MLRVLHSLDEYSLLQLSHCPEGLESMSKEKQLLLLSSFGQSVIAELFSLMN